MHQFLLYLILIFLLFLPLGRRFFSSTLNFPAKVNSPCFLPLNKRTPVGEDIEVGREIMFGMLYSGYRDGTRLREGRWKVILSCGCCPSVHLLQIDQVQASKIAAA